MTAIDEFIEEKDEGKLIKALINPSGSIEYKNTNHPPLIQVLKDGSWFIQKNKSKGSGLGIDPIAALKAALKLKK